MGFVLRGDGDDPTNGDDDPTATAPLTPGWERLPEAPIEGRLNHHAVWIGEEMIVFGGWVGTSGLAGADGPTDPPAEGAAAYNPETRTWRSIADPPTAGIDTWHRTVWTGDELLAIADGSVAGEDQAGVAYDPDADRWRSISSAGRGDLELDGDVFWTGDRVLVVGFEVGPTLGQRIVGALYDPRSDSWQRLQDGPVLGPAPGTGGGEEPAVAWTGRELIFVGPATDPAADDPVDAIGQTRMVAHALDPAANRWRELPPPPPPIRVDPTVTWTGNQVVVVGGSGHDDTPLRDGATFDPATETWSALPEAPADLTGESVIANGTQVMALDDEDPERRILLLELAERRWTSAPDPRSTGRSPMVSTGTEILFWGGSRHDRSRGEPEASAEGYSFTP